MSDGFEIIEDGNFEMVQSWEVRDAGAEWGSHTPGNILHANGYVNGKHVWVEINKTDGTCKVAFGDSPSYNGVPKLSPSGALNLIRRATG